MDAIASERAGRNSDGGLFFGGLPNLCLAGLLRRPPPPRLGVRRRKRTRRKVFDRPRLRLTFRLDALGCSLGRSCGRSLGGALDASISLREDHILIHVHIAADVAVDGRVLVEVGIDRIEGLGGQDFQQW
jgi:hypothetical protein